MGHSQAHTLSLPSLRQADVRTVLYSSRFLDLFHMVIMPVSSNIAATKPNEASNARPKVLITEKVSPDGIAQLQHTLEVHERKGLSPEQLAEIIPEYEALIVRSETKVTAALLSHASKLRVVARAGVGVDSVGTSYSWPGSTASDIDC